MANTPCHITYSQKFKIKKKKSWNPEIYENTYFLPFEAQLLLRGHPLVVWDKWNTQLPIRVGHKWVYYDPCNLQNSFRHLLMEYSMNTPKCIENLQYCLCPCSNNTPVPKIISIFLVTTYTWYINTLLVKWFFDHEHSWNTVEFLIKSLNHIKRGESFMFYL